MHLELSRLHRLCNRLSVAGEHGRLDLDLEAIDACRWLPAKAPGLEANLASRPAFTRGAWPSDFTGCFAEQLAYFLEPRDDAEDACVDAHSFELPDAFEAARTMSLVQWAYENRAPCPQPWQPGVPERGHRCENNAVRERSCLEPARVMVTGGTGFIGGALVERLVELGFDELLCPVRSHRSCAGLARHAVEMPQVDLLDEAAVARICHGTRHVFHLAFGRDGPRPGSRSRAPAGWLKRRSRPGRRALSC